MNLVEAMKSGRPYRRRGWPVWCRKTIEHEYASGEVAISLVREDAHHQVVRVEHLLADDWEVKPVEITPQQFWDAARRVMVDVRNTDGYAEISLFDYLTKGPVERSWLHDLADQLGLEPT